MASSAGLHDMVGTVGVHCYTNNAVQARRNEDNSKQQDNGNASTAAATALAMVSATGHAQVSSR